MHRRGKLIVIEGTDGSGKATQTKLLLNYLKKSQKISFFEFPRYKKSIFGNLVKRSLRGEFGNFIELSPYLSSLPYVIDRLRAKYLLNEALIEGDVICDRYTPSNLAFQGAKLPKNERKKFFDFIEVGEYKELGLPEPDVVIFLYVPIGISQKLISKRSKAKGRPDLHENDKLYQKNVIETYINLAKGRKNWHIVGCTNSRGRILSKNVIHEKILKIIKKHENN